MYLISIIEDTVPVFNPDLHQKIRSLKRYSNGSKQGPLSHLDPCYEPLPRTLRCRPRLPTFKHPCRHRLAQQVTALQVLNESACLTGDCLLILRVWATDAPGPRQCPPARHDQDCCFDVSGLEIRLQPSQSQLCPSSVGLNKEVCCRECAWESPSSSSYSPLSPEPPNHAGIHADIDSHSKWLIWRFITIRLCWLAKNELYDFQYPTTFLSSSLMRLLLHVVSAHSCKWCICKPSSSILWCCG